jgi:hypothetical protein
METDCWDPGGSVLQPEPNNLDSQTGISYDVPHRMPAQARHTTCPILLASPFILFGLHVAEAGHATHRTPRGCKYRGKSQSLSYMHVPVLRLMRVEMLCTLQTYRE